MRTKSKNKFLALMYFSLLGLASLFGHKVSGWFRPDGLIGQGDSATYEIVARFEALNNRFPDNWSDWFWPGCFWEPVQTVNYGLSPAALVKILIICFGDAWTRIWVFMQIVMILTSWFLVKNWLEGNMRKITLTMFGALYLLNPLILWSIFNVQKEILMLLFVVLILHGIVLALRSNTWNPTCLLIVIPGFMGLFWLRGWPFVFSVTTPLSFWMALQIIINPKNKKVWLKGTIAGAFLLVLILLRQNHQTIYRFYEISYQGKDCTIQALEKGDYIVNNELTGWNKKLFFEGSGNFINDRIKFEKYIRTSKTLSQIPFLYIPNQSSEINTDLKQADTAYIQAAQKQLSWKKTNIIPSIIERSILILTVKREGFLTTPGKTKINRPIPNNFISAMFLTPLSFVDGIFQPFPWVKWGNIKMSVVAWGNGIIWLWLILTFLSPCKLKIHDKSFRMGSYSTQFQSFVCLISVFWVTSA